MAAPHRSHRRAEDDEEARKKGFGSVVLDKLEEEERGSRDSDKDDDSHAEYDNRRASVQSNATGAVHPLAQRPSSRGGAKKQPKANFKATAGSIAHGKQMKSGHKHADLRNSLERLPRNTPLARIGLNIGAYRS